MSDDLLRSLQGWEHSLANEESELVCRAIDEITALRAAHEALLRRTQSLETALDQERADNEKARAEIGALRAFAQECDKESNVCQWIDPVELRLAMHRGGLLDHNGQPTALLSGRGEGGNDG